MNRLSNAVGGFAWSISLLILCAGFALSQTAQAQTISCGFPPPVGSQDSSTGNYVIRTAACETEVNSHFLNSKGTFSDAVTFLSPLSLPTSCDLDGTTANCVKYTGECNPAISTTGDCPKDPNASPGETSCWCQPPEQVPLLTLPKNSSPQVIEMELKVDSNNDRKTDRSFFSETAKNPSGPRLRAYMVQWDTHRLEWEDLNDAPDGDYNDYVHALELRECSHGEWPFHVRSSEAGQAGMVCETGGCPNLGCSAQELSTTDMRFAIAVGIDKEKTAEGAGDREPSGRKLTVTVNTYYKGAPGNKIAVCPVLLFSAPSDPTLTGVDAVYSGTPVTPPNFCSTTPGNGVPQCYPDIWHQSFPVAFAREQFQDSACHSARTGPGDVFEPPGLDFCSSGMYSQSYEISLNDIDKSLPNPGDWLDPMLAVDIRTRIVGAILYVVQDIRTPEFHCPSGVGQFFGTLDPSTARVANYSIPASDAAFNRYIRQ